MAVQQQKSPEDLAREIWTDPNKKRQILANIEANKDPLDGIDLAPKPAQVPQPPTLALPGQNLPRPTGAIDLGIREGAGLGLGLGLPLLAATGGLSLPLVVGAGLLGDMGRQKLSGRDQIDMGEASVAGAASLLPTPFRRLNPAMSPWLQRTLRTAGAGAMGGVTNTAFGMAEESKQNPQAPFLERAGRAAMEYGPEGVVMGGVLHNVLGERMIPGRRSVAEWAGEKFQPAPTAAYQPAAQAPAPAPAAPGRTPQEARLELSRLADGTELITPAGDRVIIRRSVQPKTGAANIYLEYPDGTREALIDRGKAKKGLDPFAAKVGTEFQPVYGPQLPPPPAATPPAAATVAKPPTETFATGAAAPPARVTRQRGKPPKTAAAVGTAEAVRQQTINDKVAALRTQMEKAPDKASFLAAARQKAKTGSPYSAALDILDAEVKTAAGVVPPVQAAPKQKPASPTAPVAAFKQGDAVSYTGKTGDITGRIIGPRSDKGYYPVELTSATGKTSTTTRHESLLRPAAPKVNKPQPVEAKAEVVPFAETPKAEALAAPPNSGINDPTITVHAPFTKNTSFQVDTTLPSRIGVGKKISQLNDEQLLELRIQGEAWSSDTSGAIASDGNRLMSQAIAEMERRGQPVDAFLSDAQKRLAQMRSKQQSTKLLPAPAPQTTAATAAKLIKDAAAKKSIDPNKIFGHIGKKTGGGAHPQPPTPQPGEPRSLFGRLLKGERGVLNLGLTQAELDATAPRRAKAAEPEALDWNDAIDAVHAFKKSEGGKLDDLLKMYEKYAGTPTFQRHEAQLRSAWRVLSKAPVGSRRLEPKEAKARVERAAGEEPAAFDPALSKKMVAPPTEQADFATGETKAKAEKKVAPPDQIATMAREAVKRGDYRDYNAWRDRGLEHAQAVEAALEEARDRWARDNFDTVSLAGFRKLVGKPGSKALYSKSEGRRTPYDEDLALDEGDIEGSTARIMRERGIEQADTDRGAKETVAFGARGARGTKAGTSQYETFKENLGAEEGMVEGRRGGSKKFYLRKPVGEMSAEELAAYKREEDFMDRMWAQVLEQGSDAKGRGVPHRPAPLLSGAEREAAMHGRPEAEARATVPPKPPAFKRSHFPIRLRDTTKAGTAPTYPDIYRPEAKPVVKKFTGAKTSKGAPIFEARPKVEGTAPDRTGVKLFPSPKRLPVPEKFETLTHKTSKGERVFEETTKGGTPLSPTPLRHASKGTEGDIYSAGILTERPTSEFRRPKAPVRGVLPTERARMPKKAPADRPFYPGTQPAPSEPMSARGNVRSEIHPIGGAGYRAAETSTGKNLRSRLSDTSDLTVRQGSIAPFKVREKSGLTPSMRDRLDARELERDLKDLQRGGPRGVRRYERAGTQMSMTGELESAGGVRQLAREMGKIELSDAEMTAARKAYDRMVESRLPAKLLAAIARSKDNSPSLRIAALQRLREIQSAKLGDLKQQKLNASVRQQIEAKQQQRSGREVAAEAQIRTYLGESGATLKPLQASAISRRYRLTQGEIADLTNKVLAERTLGPAKEAKGLPPPPSSGGRPPLFQRLLHDDSGVVGGRAAQQSIDQRRAEKIAKRKAFLQSKGAPYDEQLEANRAAVEERDPGTFLSLRDRTSRKLLDTHIAYEVATRLTGKQFPSGSSPLEWVHAIAGGGTGKPMAAAIRLHDVEAPHWKKIPRAEWDTADQAVDYALAYEQIAHTERIMQDRVNEAKKILASTQQIGVTADIAAAKNLLRYEKARLKDIQVNGIGVKGGKITPATAQARMQALMAQAPPTHKALINDVLTQTRVEFEKSLEYRIDPDVQTLTPNVKQQWISRGAYMGGLYRVREAGAETGRAMIAAMQARGKLTADEANLLRRFSGLGDDPVITGRDSVYRTLFRDYRDAERAKLVNMIVNWFGDVPELMQKAPKRSTPTPAGFMPVFAWENGQPVKYFLHEDLASPILGASLLETQLAGMSKGLLRKINTISARLGTSLSPAWQVVTNPQRDVKAKRLGTFTPEGKRAFPMTPWNALKDFTYDYVKNFYKVASHHRDYLDMLEHYGGQSGLVGALAPDLALEGIMKRNKQTGSLGPATRGSLLRSAPARLGHTFENTPKVSGYTQLVKLGVPKNQAGIIARQWSGTADLSVHGEYGPGMQVGALYLNANVQEKRRWGRDLLALKSGDPAAMGRAVAKAQSVAMRRIMYAVVGTTAMAMANAKYNRQFRDKDGNPEIDHIPPEVLEQNWIWFTPQTSTDVNGDTRFVYVKSPKETPQQVVAPLVLGLMGYASKGDHEGAQRYAEEWFNALFPGRAKADFSSVGSTGKSLAQGLWSNVAPWARVPANLMTNTEQESGRAIVPKKMVEKNLSPENRYTAYTNRSSVRRAKQLAEYGIHISPKQIEYAAKNGLGALGSIAIDTDETIGQWLGTFKSPESKDPFQRFKRFPILGVMVSRALGPGNVDGQELRDTDLFYKKADEARRFNADLNVWKQERRIDPSATPSVFLRSKDGQFWMQGNKADAMLELERTKGELLSKNAALLSKFKSPATTDEQREKLAEQINLLRQQERRLLKTFREKLLGEKPTVPPPPTTGFWGFADLRNRQK